VGSGGLDGKVTALAWKVKPSCYLVATDDPMIAAATTGGDGGPSAGIAAIAAFRQGVVSNHIGQGDNRSAVDEDCCTRSGTTTTAATDAPLSAVAAGASAPFSSRWFATERDTASP
jgi:hypothetical protein